MNFRFAGLIFVICTYLAHSQKLPPQCQAPLTVPQLDSSFINTHTLIGVHVVTRHGDRVPETPLPILRVPWDCSDANQLMGISGLSSEFRKRYLPHDISDPLLGTCSVGQLTSRGISQHIILGESLAVKYRQDIPFMRSPQPGDILIRSTNIDRTIQSAQNNIAGFFNDTKIFGDLYDLWISPAGDPLLPSSLSAICPAILKLNTWGNPEIPKIMAKYADLLTESQKLFGISPDLFSVIFLHDGVICRYCHNSTYPLPNSVTTVYIQTLDNFFSEIISSTYQVGTHLIADPLIYELFGTSWMTAATNQANLIGPKYGLWSGHDVTLGFLLVGLNLTNYIPEPPFVSHAEFELWKSNTNSTYFIKAAYNGEYLNIPYCNSETCDFVGWYNSLNILTPDEWDQKCAQ